MVSLSINAFGDFMLRLSEQDYHRLVNKEPLKYDVQKNDENDEKEENMAIQKLNVMDIFLIVIKSICVTSI